MDLVSLLCPKMLKIISKFINIPEFNLRMKIAIDYTWNN